MFETLAAKGFQVEFQSHAEAILSMDFPEAVSELEGALSRSSIPIEEIIAGGGGESRSTQRLHTALAGLAWPQFTFIIESGPTAYRGRASHTKSTMSAAFRVAHGSRWKSHVTTSIRSMTLILKTLNTCMRTGPFRLAQS